jgi:hypothetical protein
MNLSQTRQPATLTERAFWPKPCALRFARPARPAGFFPKALGEAPRPKALGVCRLLWRL